MENNYKKQWGFLKRNFESENLAHAFLFSGQDLESIKSFTKDFIKLVNCLYLNPHGRENMSIKEKPCGECQYCKMIKGESFPDLLTVRSLNSKSSKNNEKDMMEISIEQIRNAQNFLSYKAYYGNYKVVIIENADRMNTEAQSCFLKTLEEPKGKTMIFLITSKPDFLLPTIFSRCQQIKFFSTGNHDMLPEEQKMLQEVKRILSSDLAEKFSFAKNTNLENGNFLSMLIVLQKYFREQLLSKLGIGESSDTNYSVEKLKKMLKQIDEMQYQSNKYNINQKMALDLILIES